MGTLVTQKKWSSENTVHGAVAWCHGNEVIHSFEGMSLLWKVNDETIHAKIIVKELDHCSWNRVTCGAITRIEHVATAHQFSQNQNCQ